MQRRFRVADGQRDQLGEVAAPASTMAWVTDAVEFDPPETGAAGKPNRPTRKSPSQREDPARRPPSGENGVGAGTQVVRCAEAPPLPSAVKRASADAGKRQPGYVAVAMPQPTSSLPSRIDRGPDCDPSSRTSPHRGRNIPSNNYWTKVYHWRDARRCDLRPAARPGNLSAEANSSSADSRAKVPGVSPGPRIKVGVATLTCSRWAAGRSDKRT